MKAWPKVALGELLRRSDESAVLDPAAEYHEVTIKLWGKGVISRGKVFGSDVVSVRRVVRANQLILSKIDARNGAIGLVPPELDGAIVSNDFEAHLDAAERDAEHLLALRFRDTVANAPLRTMAEVAPSVRRPVGIDIEARYREVGARSFGKGLFLKPDFDGAEATWQKPVWIKSGDLVLSNIKAWEGAVAVAGAEHDGCIASHRYITCVPEPKQATAGFLAYYLLSEDGMEKIGAASPGTADRNRTLSLSNLGKIEVPVPPLSAQQSFDHLQAEVAALKAQHASLRAANAALLPATLERVFSQ